MIDQLTASEEELSLKDVVLPALKKFVYMLYLENSMKQTPAWEAIWDVATALLEIIDRLS